MIAPDSAAELRAERRFDLVAAVLIGTIAVLAALLAVVQIDASQSSTRANLEAARLAADLSTRISVSNQATDSALGAQQTALMLGIESAARGIAGFQNNDPTSTAIGSAGQSAFTELQAALAATSATTGSKPVDPYTAGLLNATAQQYRPSWPRRIARSTWPTPPLPRNTLPSSAFRSSRSVAF